MVDSIRPAEREQAERIAAARWVLDVRRGRVRPRVALGDVHPHLRGRLSRAAGRAAAGAPALGHDHRVDDWVMARLAAAPVGRLATTSRDGVAHLVPVCFALVEGRAVSVVDHKPKRTLRLADAPQQDMRGTLGRAVLLAPPLQRRLVGAVVDPGDGRGDRARSGRRGRRPRPGRRWRPSTTSTGRCRRPDRCGRSPSTSCAGGVRPKVPPGERTAPRRPADRPGASDRTSEGSRPVRRGVCQPGSGSRPVRASSAMKACGPGLAVFRHHDRDRGAVRGGRSRGTPRRRRRSPCGRRA